MRSLPPTIPSVFEAKRRANPTDSAHIGHTLKELRVRAGLTQAELAQRLQIGQTALSHLEGRADILVSTLRSYLEAVGATLRVDSEYVGRDDLIDTIKEMPLVFDHEEEDQLLLPILADLPFPPRKDVIFSIKPVYSERILAGSKRVELRRRFPRKVPKGTFALIYSTSPTRALTGMAEISGVASDTPGQIWRSYRDVAGIEKKDYDAYFADVNSAFAIELTNPRTFPRPLGLSELRDRFGFEPPQSFVYASSHLREVLSNEFSEISY